MSDDERSHVLALLEKATGRGLIDLGEYTERSARVISARTRGDLNAVLRTFVLATVAVPIVIYGLMPHLHRARVRLMSRATS